MSQNKNGQPLKKIEQKAITQLIESGAEVGLLIEQEVYDGELGFSLYCRFADQTTPIYTQRSQHRRYRKFDAAVDWGRKVGFTWASFHIDYKKTAIPSSIS